MNAWLSRNASPIAIVLIASGVVIGVFEVLDAFTGSTPSAASPEGAEAPADELVGIASLAGLIKVMAFLLVSGGLTLLVRRRSGSK